MGDTTKHATRLPSGQHRAGRRGLVIALDSALALGTAALGLAASAGTSSATTPPPTGWASTEVPVPTPPGPYTGSGGPKPFIDNEACAGNGTCVLGGEFLDASNHQQALITTDTTTGPPSSVVAPIPSDAAADPVAEVYNVARTYTGQIFAGGGYKNGSDDTRPFIDQWTPSGWVLDTLPVPAGVATSQFAYIDDVTSAPTTCVAVGGYGGFKDSQPWADEWSAGSWHALAVSAGPAGATSAELDYVSCPSDGSCVAVGDDKNPSGTGLYVDTLSGGALSTVALPSPSDSEASPNVDLQVGDISCTSLTSCVVGGGYANTSGQNEPLLEQLSASGWQTQITPMPSDAGTGSDTDAAIAAVSCTADGTCQAVGYYEQSSTVTAGLIETWSGSSWTPLSAPTPSTADGNASLSDVSCTSDRACVAVGDYTATPTGFITSGNEKPLVETLSGTSSGHTLAAPTWTPSVAPLPSNAGTGSNGLHEVSCPVGGACYAVATYQDNETTSEQQAAIDTYTPPQGYTESASDGGLFNYGSTYYGSASQLPLNKPIVGMAATASGKGYWQVATDGGIFNYGDAGYFGSASQMPLNKPIVGMAATPDGGGYWEVASDGGIFNYGDAGFYGSAGSIALNKPIVGMAATPDGKGYWLVASDGGIFAYGDAPFYGSMGGKPLNKPIVGIASSGSGGGYWEVASDGGLFAFGDAPYQGSAGSIALNKPVVGIVATYDAQGYWEIATDGGLFNYGDASFLGSAASQPLVKPVVGGAPL